MLFCAFSAQKFCSIKKKQYFCALFVERLDTRGQRPRRKMPFGGNLTDCLTL